MTLVNVRDRHAELRARFAERPEEARSAKWARTTTAGVPASDPCHGEVEVGRGYGVSFAYGLDRLVGGDHDLPNPGDMLCAALAACEDGTIRMIAALMGIELEDLEVEVSGELDVRGTLAIDRGVDVGFRRLDCAVAVRPAQGTSPEAARRLLAAAERYCVNVDTLRTAIDVEMGEA